jgi:hypothetical protein
MGYYLPGFPLPGEACLRVMIAGQVAVSREKEMAEDDGQF